MGRNSLLILRIATKELTVRLCEALNIPANGDALERKLNMYKPARFRDAKDRNGKAKKHILGLSQMHRKSESKYLEAAALHDVTINPPLDGEFYQLLTALEKEVTVTEALKPLPTPTKSIIMELLMAFSGKGANSATIIVKHLKGGRTDKPLALYLAAMWLSQEFGTSLEEDAAYKLDVLLWHAIRHGELKYVEDDIIKYVTKQLPMNVVASDFFPDTEHWKNSSWVAQTSQLEWTMKAVLYNTHGPTLANKPASVRQEFFIRLMLSDLDILLDEISVKEGSKEGKWHDNERGFDFVFTELNLPFFPVSDVRKGISRPAISPEFHWLS